MSGPVTKLPRLAELMLKAKVVDEFQMRSALARQAQWGHRLTRIMNDMRLAPEAKVVQALSEQTRIPTVDLALAPVDQGALRKLDQAFCLEKGVYPFALQDQGKTLHLAMCDPTDYLATTEVEKKSRCRLKLFVAGEQAVAAAIQRGYARGTTGGNTPASAYPAAEGIELEVSDSGVEFVDAGGQAVRQRAISVPNARVPTQASPPPTPRPPPPVQTPTADALDSLFDFTPEALTPEEKQRLELVRQNQHRGSLILRAVLELCVEKGLLSADDVNRLRL